MTAADLFKVQTAFPWLEHGTIFLTVHGSQAYGTATPTSDIDLKGVAIPPLKYHMGFVHTFEQAEASERQR